MSTLRLRTIELGSWIAAICLAGSAVWAAPVPRPVNPVPRSPEVESALREAAQSVLNVDGGRVASLSWDRSAGAGLRTTVPINGEELILDFQPFSVRTHDFHILAQVEDGSLVEVEPSPARTLRGRVSEIEGSEVAGSLTDAGLEAVVVMPDGARFWIEPLAGRVVGAAASDHLIYRADQVRPSQRTCAVADARDERIQREVERDGEVAAGGLLFYAEVAIDADFEYFQRYGSVSAVQDQIESIINTMNVEYERDIQSRNLISTIIVRTAEPDPYASTDAGSLLNRFRDQWVGFHANVQRDAAQLFTGKNLDGNTSGIAFANSLCFPQAAFCLVQSDGCSSFACKTDLSAHELGHVWSANHCSCPGYTMNPVISSGNRFHPVFDIPDLIAFRNTRTCLSFVDKCNVIGTPDCNENGVADGCDLSSGTSSDVDLDGNPDECQPPSIPGIDPNDVFKNRAIVLTVPPSPIIPPGTLSALRVRLSDLHNPNPPNFPPAVTPDFSAFRYGSTCTDPAGCVRWVGPPSLFLENQDLPDRGTIKAAELQCEPYYHDWVSEGFVYVRGAEILPSSFYQIENYRDRCAGREATCAWVSTLNQYYTSRHGDVVEPFDPPDTDGQPDALDITAMLNKFRSLPGAPSKVFAQLQPNAPDFHADLNGIDIVIAVDAFRRRGYPFSGPCACPSTVVCGATPCSGSAPCGGSPCVRTCAGGTYDERPCRSDAHCPGGTCGSGFCRDACGRCRP